MAKFKVGDRVAYYGSEKSIYRLRGKVSDVSQIRGEAFVTVDLDNGEEWGAPEKDWTLSNSRACNGVRSRNAVVAKALNACARNGAYDTFEIRKDPKYGNFWCIYPQGVSARAVSRVFDTPEIAKKYVRDNFPGVKVRVKNACGTARNA